MNAPAGLSHTQAALLARWLPGVEVMEDLSWGLVGTTVLLVRDVDDHRYIVKAGNADDTHIARELQAHRRWLTPWTAVGRAPGLAFADGDARILVTHHVPGRLVQGTPAEHDPETYRQAGRLLALLHEQLAVTDDGEFEHRQKAATLKWLHRPHRIANAV